MNRPIRTLAIGFLVLFLGLLGRATYLQFFDASNLDSLTAHGDNARALSDSYNRPRGEIIVPGLKSPIALSKPVGDQYKFQRIYPYGAQYAQITGYFAVPGNYSPLGGLEYAQNKALSGEDDQLFLRHLSDILSNKQTPGENVILTINPAAQSAAFQGLTNLRRNSQGQKVIGSVVALDPSSGRILAMASIPSYDPSQLALHNPTAVGKSIVNLQQKVPSPINNAAIQDRVPPGSTFKLVTASAALSSGKYTPKTMVSGAAAWQLPGTHTNLTNENNFTCGAARVTLTVALDNSCNVAFGQVGNSLGNAALNAQAEKYGFGQTYFNELNDPFVYQVPSVFPAGANQPNTVLSAIGQYEVQATPLQMALVAAGIANGGTVMAPYLVNEVQAPDLSVVYQASPHELNNLQPAVSPTVAAQLTQMMQSVVTNGTGTSAQIPGISVAGKTGTAQTTKTNNPYAWFVSFAPAQNPKVAVAVLIQNAGIARNDISGGGLAAPIAKCVMEAVITPNNLTADCKA